ncbi:O-antigen ligase family protein [Deinococcus pimensis]|uniref:O-antigen ligase family protein n=1 Tax=Deinococcus pimensis TaxID=309888 RepID=UPI0004BB977A|nr:O-antigen ligase family protein [Deinococcus pimensis]
MRKSSPVVPGQIPLPHVLLLTLLAALVSVTVPVSPLAAIALAVVTLGLGVVLTLRRQLPTLALGLLGLTLLGYATLGRGFAYVGVAPLFIGEITLALCLAATVLATRWTALLRSPVVLLLLAYMAVGAAATVPYVGRYGLDALRDAALWYYALFAVLVAALLLQRGLVVEAARRYARLVPLFLIWMPIAVVIDQVARGVIPPFPGSSVSLLDVKGGDVAVHLAVVAGLLVLGLGPRLYPRLVGHGREWLWWVLWLAAAAIPVFRVRAGLIAIAAALLLIVLLRPGSRWGKPFAVVSLTVFLFFASGISLSFGSSRYVISADTLLLNLRSITGSTGNEARDGSRRWRLQWWNDITDYTVHGPYFWTGKGYGVNLADADGFQVYDDGSLRSPHSVHYNVLARSGVPGLVVWAALQLTFALSLLVAYFRASSRGQDLWARLNLWVLASWLAFMVNASFDVFLEGPQGGIWFWSLFGFGVALLEAQRREARSPRAALPAAGRAA